MTFRLVFLVVVVVVLLLPFTSAFVTIPIPCNATSLASSPINQIWYAFCRVFAALSLHALCRFTCTTDGSAWSYYIDLGFYTEQQTGLDHPFGIAASWEYGGGDNDALCIGQPTSVFGSSCRCEHSSRLSSSQLEH